MNARAILQFSIVALIWGTTWFVIKDQLAVVNPSWSVTYRFLTGGLVLIFWCLWRGIPLKLPREAAIFAAAMGLFQFMVNFNLVYRSELYIPSGIPAVAFALLMVPNAVLAGIFLGRHISRRFLLGSALGIAGVGMLFYQQLSFPGDRAGTMVGLTLVALAICSASIANVLQATPRALAIPPLAGLGWAMLMGSAMNAVFAFAVAGPPQWDARPEYLIGLLYLGIFASAIAFALYFDLIRAIGPAEAAWTGVPIPIIAMAISTMAEGYRWSPLAALGAVVAIVGLIIALRQPKTQVPEIQAPEVQT